MVSFQNLSPISLFLVIELCPTHSLLYLGKCRILISIGWLRTKIWRNRFRYTKKPVRVSSILEYSIGNQYGYKIITTITSGTKLVHQRFNK